MVYVPSCVTRMMGPSVSDTETKSVHEVLLSLFEKAGYEVRRLPVCICFLAYLHVCLHPCHALHSLTTAQAPLAGHIMAA